MGKVYQEFAKCLGAWKACCEMVPRNHEWEPRWDKRIKDLVDGMPHGSGIDGEWVFDRENSGNDELNFYCSYHHMDEYGGYDGWTDFKARVWPDLQFGFRLRIVGPFPKKYSDTRDYLHEVIDCYLNEEVGE